MKRIAILFCALALLLTACVPPTAPETTQAPTTPGTAQTAEPPERPTQAPTALPPEPSQTEPAQTDPPITEPGYQAGGSPTAGGVVVYTDPSAYRPYAGSEAKYTRLREGPLDHFAPSDDYGAVYPYTAARLFKSLEDGQSWEAGARYGLVDASGRILTDGIYASVLPLTEYDYEGEETIYLPYWITEIIVDVEYVTEGIDGELYTYLDGESYYGVISLDGSFALPTEYRGISILGEGFRCTRDWDGVSFEVYDGSGRLLFTGAELLKDDYSRVSVSDGGEGFYLVELYDDNWDTEAWFCDSRGERALGPFAEADAFSDGLACVSLDGERYGYIDVTGAWILEPRFTEISSFRNGRAIHRAEDDSVIVIDLEGNVVLTLERDVWLYWESGCFRAYRSNSNGESFYDIDGNVLYSTDSWANCLDGDAFWEHNDGSGTRIFHPNGAELTVPVQINSIYSGLTVLGGEAVKGYFASGFGEDGTRCEYFVLGDLSAFHEIGNGGLPTQDAYYTYYSTVDQCTNEKWYLAWTGTAWEAVSEAGEIHSVPLRVKSLTIRGDRIMALTDRACVYVDWEGKLLFSYPLDGGD